jgi:hypothetical protein
VPPAAADRPDILLLVAGALLAFASAVPDARTLASS